MGDANLAPTLASCRKNAITLFRIDGHRLFDEHVSTSLQRTDREVRVSSRRRTDVYCVEPLGFEHFSKIVVDFGNAVRLSQFFRLCHIGIAQSDNPSGSFDFLPSW